jgi:uncharacterized membrane protein
MNWEIFLGSFAGSLIELVEILGVAIVVGRIAGWQNALVGSGSGIAVVVIGSLFLGTSLTLVPLQILKIVAGGFLLAFGQRWTRSIIRYYGGILKRKDDEDEQLEAALAQDGGTGHWNGFAIVTTFKSALLETFEVAIAVVTLGAAAGQWTEAISGATAAAVGLAGFAFLLRGPLNRVPVKPMKFAAAMLLMGFGTYWLGEGLGLTWPLGPWAIVALPLLWGTFMAVIAIILKAKTVTQPQEIAS